MRQLNKTGFMHNRVRMLVASFLQTFANRLALGRAYFAEKLFDYEMASNVGNWQWAAGSGVDAAPYFRILTLTSKSKNLIKLVYVNKWIDDLSEPIRTPLLSTKWHVNAV